MYTVYNIVYALYRLGPCRGKYLYRFVFAILGLRSLYFVFANIIHQFYYLRLGLAVILSYVGMKMVLTDLYHIPSALSLLVIAFVLAIVASLLLLDVSASNRSS